MKHGCRLLRKREGRNAVFEHDGTSCGAERGSEEAGEHRDSGVPRLCEDVGHPERHGAGVDICGRDHDHEDRVEDAAFEHRPGRLAVVFGRRGRNEVERVSRRGLRHDARREAFAQRLGHERQFEAPRRERVRDECSGAAGVADDSDPVSPDARHSGERRGEQEGLFERFGDDGARLGEQHPGEPAVPREAARVRARRRRSGLGAAGFQNDDGLGGSSLPEDARESRRVGNRFEVGEDDLCVRVVRVERQQVACGHVGLVPRGRDAREAEPERIGEVEQRRADRAALRDEADAAALRDRLEHVRVQPNGGIGVQDAHAVRPHEAHAVPVHDVHERAFLRLAFPAGLAEAGRERDHRADALPSALLGDFEDEFRRNREHREVDVARDVENRAVSRNAVDGLALPVHGEDAPGEVVAPDVPEDRVADARTRRRTDDGDALRREEAFGAPFVKRRVLAPRLETQALRGRNAPVVDDSALVEPEGAVRDLERRACADHAPLVVDGLQVMTDAVLSFEAVVGAYGNAGRDDQDGAAVDEVGREVGRRADLGLSARERGADAVRARVGAPAVLFDGEVGRVNAPRDQRTRDDGRRRPDVPGEQDAVWRVRREKVEDAAVVFGADGTVLERRTPVGVKGPDIRGEAGNTEFLRGPERLRIRRIGEHGDDLEGTAVRRRFERFLKLQGLPESIARPRGQTGDAHPAPCGIPYRLDH